jgi:parallel beta-helix repeat protein
MSRRLYFAILIVCIIIFVISTYVVLVRFSSLQPKTQSGYSVHNLNTGLNYTNIQAAIDAPETLDGQTILIDEQTYYEHVVVNKSLSLIGGSEDHTIVDGNGTGNIIHIIASDVTIKNLTVTNGTIGIILDSSNNDTITRNNVRNNDYEGIYLKGCSNNTISYNNVRSNGEGIWLSGCSSNNISHNNVADSRDGILVNSSSNNSISYNNVTGNSNYGIGLNFSSNSTISYDNVTSNYEGVYIDYSNNSCVTKIIAIKNGDAIVVRYSHNSTIQRGIAGNNTERGIFVTNSHGFNVNNNNVYNNQWYGINANFSVSGLVKQNEANKNHLDGVGMFDSGDCVIAENNVSNNLLHGILVERSYNLSIYNNNFINNPPGGQASYAGFSRESWDNGYPSGGNYWSDYAGVDLYSGPYQNVTGSDGIGDTPYEIDENNTDNYPLMGMFWSFNTTYNYGVNIVSNSLISNFSFILSGVRQATLSFNVFGGTGTQGFCRICIPKALINASYVVKLDGEILTYKELPCSNETYECLYINYMEGEHKIEISGTTPIA